MTRREICIKAANARAKKMKATFFQRFWSKISIGADNGCWNWTGSLNGDGYGQIKKEGVAVMVHRLAFAILVKEIPKHLQACHRCDNPRCCNPDHIFIGTARDNVYDCMAKGRRRHRHGDDHHNAKITDDQVRELRRIYPEYAAAGRREELGKLFGIHPGHAQNIFRRIRRKDVI